MQPDEKKERRAGGGIVFVARPERILDREIQRKQTDRQSTMDDEEETNAQVDCVYAVVNIVFGVFCKFFCRFLLVFLFRLRNGKR